MDSKYNSIQLLGTLHDISFEQIKSVKPLVIKVGQTLRVFQSETKSISHNSIISNWLKETARKHIIERTNYIANTYNFHYNRLSIKNQRTRWGSCSGKKNLNFNWRLIMTPHECVDYVIIHELAHTKQMNHSKNFWAIVEEIMPDYKSHKKTLHAIEQDLFRLKL
jgi:hypothetical protein